MTHPASISAILLAVLLAIPVNTWADDPPRPVAREAVDFDRDVKPIFAKQCLSCHGPDKQKQGLRLDRKHDALKGGDSGVAIVPGKSADSLLFQLVSGLDKDRQMPPKGGLSSAEIATLKAWIDRGAKWPDDGSIALNPTDWWSLKPLTKAKISPTPNPQPPTSNSIDHFILAKLKEKGLSPSPEADRRTLIRRLYFDLVGLP
ncbi:MAG TPA: c-type cytochrome domain-containing protein, partial [Gemmata sp.]|nr:c-type cytochrome domain-containing protein [Gemmata sp.]